MINVDLQTYACDVYVQCVHACFPAIKPENPATLSVSHGRQRSLRSGKDGSETRSTNFAIHAAVISLKYVSHRRQTGKTNLGCARGQKKIGHRRRTESARTRARAIYAIIQADLYKQQFGLLRSNNRCAAVTAIFHAALRHGTSERKAEIRRTSIEGNPRLRRAMSRGQFANSHRFLKIYDTPEIFHYRFSYYTRRVMYVLTYHTTHLSRMCNVCLCGRCDLNSDHVFVINAITYKLRRELEPRRFISGFPLSLFLHPSPLSLSHFFFLSLSGDYWSCGGQERVSRTYRLQLYRESFPNHRQSTSIYASRK